MSEGEITIGQLFDYLTRKFEDIEKRFDDGEKRFNKIEYVTSQTLLQAKETNGRVTHGENWEKDHDAAHQRAAEEARVAQSFDDGAQSERRRFRQVLSDLGQDMTKPLAYGAAAVLVGFGIRLGAWFVGGLW